MTSRDFCYWLQGFFEIGKPTALDVEQTALVKRHLALVFLHEIDPSAGPPEHQAVLDAVHGGSAVDKPLPAWKQPQDPDGPLRMRC